jgi:hypothetical protein
MFVLRRYHEFFFTIGSHMASILKLFFIGLKHFILLLLTLLVMFTRHKSLSF